MANHQVLDNFTHKELKVITDRRPGLGDDASYTTVVVSEFREVQGEYPIFLRKNAETGQFETIAMFGFAQQENLYLDEAGWHAGYIPLSIQRRPFMIGFNQVQKGGILKKEPVVFIDMDSPRISESEGEQVFLEQGGQSGYLQQVSSILKALHEGHQLTEDFIHTLVELTLIEPVTLKVTLKDQSKHELNALYTINEEKVRELTGETLQKMHQKGYLQVIHMMEASMSNLNKLIEMKNATL